MEKASNVTINKITEKKKNKKKSCPEYLNIRFSFSCVISYLCAECGNGYLLTWAKILETIRESGVVHYHQLVGIFFGRPSGPFPDYYTYHPLLKKDIEEKII